MSIYLVRHIGMTGCTRSTETLKKTCLTKGKPVRLTNYVDANLMHDRFTGQSCSGILHFVNQTPIDHFCKR